MVTRAEYYAARNGGRWRTARIIHRCDWREHGTRCRNDILVGQKYFDTGLPNPNSSNPKATYRICSECGGVHVLKGETNYKRDYSTQSFISENQNANNTI